MAIIYGCSIVFVMAIAADIFNFVYTLAQMIELYEQIKIFGTQMH